MRMRVIRKKDGGVKLRDGADNGIYNRRRRPPDVEVSIYWTYSSDFWQAISYLIPCKQRKSSEQEYAAYKLTLTRRISDIVPELRVILLTCMPILITDTLEYLFN